MTIISTTVGKKPVEERDSPKCSTWVWSQKWQNDLCFQGKWFSITVIQVYATTSNTEEVEIEQLYEDWQDLLELTPKKICPFHHRGLECKVGSKKISGVTGNFVPGVQNEADQRLTEFCQENTLVIANTLFQTILEITLHMDITRWSILKSDW